MKSNLDKLEPFGLICHHMALAEARLVEVPTTSTLAPKGRYFLWEYYCTDPRCDCRRVGVQFIEDAEPSRVMATIHYGWEKAGFYKKWSRSRDPSLWREMAGASLEPLGEQGPHAEGFLKIFDHIIKDRQLVAAFRRHYALVKQTIAKP